MEHWVFRTAVAFAACLAALAGQVRAEIATFDQLRVPTDPFTLLSLREYKGLRWKGIDVVDGAHPFFDTLARCGYRTGIVSGGQVAIVANRFQNEAEITSPQGALFNLHSVYLTAAWRNGLRVDFEGWKAGRRRYAKSVTVDTTRPTRVRFGFRGIDRLRIHSSGGVDVGICKDKDCRPGPEAVIDNFSFSWLAAPRATAPPSPQSVRRPTSSHASPAPETRVRKTCPAGRYHGVQVGAFRSLKNAMDLLHRLSTQYGPIQIHAKPQGGRSMYRVVVGCLDQARLARGLLTQLQKDGVQGFVVWVSEAAMGHRL